MPFFVWIILFFSMMSWEVWRSTERLTQGTKSITYIYAGRRSANLTDIYPFECHWLSAWNQRTVTWKGRQNTVHMARVSLTLQHIGLYVLCLWEDTSIDCWYNWFFGGVQGETVPVRCKHSELIMLVFLILGETVPV